MYIQVLDAGGGSLFYAILNPFWLFRVPLGIQKSLAIGGRRLVAVELEGDLPARMDALRSTGGRKLHM